MVFKKLVLYMVSSIPCVFHHKFCHLETLVKELLKDFSEVAQRREKNIVIEVAHKKNTNFARASVAEETKISINRPLQ